MKITDVSGIWNVMVAHMYSSTEISKLCIVVQNSVLSPKKKVYREEEGFVHRVSWGMSRLWIHTDGAMTKQVTSSQLSAGPRIYSIDSPSLLSIKQKTLSIFSCAICKSSIRNQRN